MVKNLPAMWETWLLQSLGWEDSPGGGHGSSLRYSSLEYPHGQRSLAGCSPWGHRELDMTERLSTDIANTPRPDQRAARTQSLLCLVFTQATAPPHPRGPTATSVSGDSAAPSLLFAVPIPHEPSEGLRKVVRGRKVPNSYQ